MSSQFQMTPYDPSREPDFWSEVPGAPQNGTALAAGRPATPPISPLDRVRRLLRGRTTLAIVLAIAGGLIGASLGWASQKRQYRATGWVRIEPQQRTTSGQTDPIPAYRQFMASEVQVIESLPIAAEALQQPAWQAIEQDWKPKHFAGSVDAKFTNENSYIYIHFDHADPKVAEAGATAAIQAYEKYFIQRKAELDARTGEAMLGKKEELDEEIARIDQQIEEKAKEYGGLDNLGRRKEKLEQDEDKALGEIRALEQNLRLAIEARDRVLSAAPLTVEELALGDSELFRRLGEIELLKKQREDRIATGAGPSHPHVRNLTQLINSAELNLQQLADRVRQVYYGQIPNPSPSATTPTVPLTAYYIDSLELERQRLEQELKRIEAVLAPVARDDRFLQDLRNLRGALNNQLIEARDRLGEQMRNSEFQQLLANIEAFPPPAGSAAVAKDRRKHMALGGAIFGFGLPLGAIILIGLLDRRFRYSEDAAEAAERVTLLGILPNLPDRLSDPNQASIAAHCVHQIRTILQINHGSEESRAFAITSASRGDGKTSLALALGLSYAASGARTLLVDTDLQHGGLSARLGVSGDEGIMDALTGGELLRFVCETDVDDLALLPIGRAAANHAGAFSPGAVLHMLDQAKRHFDVIICDTGPILGSIEATPIASAVDGVVVTVSRGQSRPLVSKALKHLEQVGATVAGLVFNRAQASDFERSVSGMNLRNGWARANGKSRSGALPSGSVVSHN